MIILEGKRARLARVPFLLTAADCIDEDGLFGRAFGRRVGATFTRGSRGGFLDQAAAPGYVPNGMPRRSAINGRQSLLVEGAATQLVSQPQTPAAWSTNNTPTLTTGQPDPWGTNVGLRIDYNAGSQGKFLAVSFTGDGTKSLLFCIRAHDATTDVVLSLQDNSAAATRHRVRVTFPGGPDVEPMVVTHLGSGIIAKSQRVRRDGRTHWLIGFTADNVVAANNNIIYCYGSTGYTGTVYLAGANAWDASHPWSWQPTSGHVRARDDIAFPVPRLAVDATLYIAGTSMGAATIPDGSYGASVIAAIGTFSTGWKLSIRHDAGNSHRRPSSLVQGPGGSAEQAVSTPNNGSVLGYGAPYFETALRYRAADGAVSGVLSCDGSVAESGYGSGNLTTPPTEWHSAQLLLSSSSSGATGFAFTHICYAFGRLSLDEIYELTGQ